MPSDETCEEDREDGPHRRCIFTAESRSKSELIRFVVGPDTRIVPDISGRLPGRGLWLTSRRDIVAAAVAKRAFARAARAPVIVEPDLEGRVESLLVRRCGELIGLARRAGQAVAGFVKVKEALASGTVGLLLAASDGAEGGREKVRTLAPELPLVDRLTGAELGAAFGRDVAVHGAVSRGKLAAALAMEADRLAGFRGA